MITEDTITSDTWKAFKDILATVSSVSITGGEVVSIKSISNSYPDKYFENKKNYPILIVNSPEFDTNPVTYRNHEYTGRITMELFTNQAESADKFRDKFLKAVRDNLLSLRKIGIQEVEVDDTSSTHYDRTVELRVHSRMITWRFKVYF
jgi:hypothetical protein